MRKIVKRSRKSLVDSVGYVDLSTACIRANETGFFGLSSRVAPESFDGENTNIDPRECFFGGRRVELALQVRHAEDVASKSQQPSQFDKPAGDVGTGSGEQV